MDSGIIEAVKKATCDLFSTMMNMEIVAGDLIEDKTTIKDEVVISGIIGLAGAYKGNIALHFSKNIALKSISAMMGMDCDELTEEMNDAIGEIANIVAGGTKTELATQDVSFDLSLPTVISGNNYSIAFNDNSNKAKSVLCPFLFEDERFFVEFDIEKDETK